MNTINSSVETEKSLEILSQTKVLEKDFTVYGTAEEPLFLARDVAEMIDYAKTSKGSYDVSNMLKTIDEDEKMVRKVFVSSKMRDVWMLTENGLYEVLMQSTKPIAKQFKKEIKKILHAIRTNGGYIAGQETLSDSELLAKAMLVANRVIDQKNRQIESMKPKAEFFDKVTGSRDTHDMKEVAKLLNFKNIGRTTLFEILRKEGILDKNNHPYQKYVNAGYFRLIETKWEDRDGDTHINLKTVVFQKGIEFIRKTICKSDAYIESGIASAADRWLAKEGK